MDFIGPLATSQGCNMILVITDRLSKGVILEPCESIDADYIAKLFLRTFYRRHGVPSAITSDRGRQFVNQMWKRICQLLKINRRLSTAYHPETDGQTERINAEVEVLLRQWVNYEQDNWADALPMVELALNGRESSTTGFSSFFLSHGYHLDPLELFEEPTVRDIPTSPREKGDQIVAKLRNVSHWAQLSMAEAQQEQERQANRHRVPSPAYKVGDKVWLDLRNIRTERPTKKLDSRTAKFMVTEVIGPHSYRLNVPQGIDNVFNVDLLRPAASDPFPSQRQDDTQPPPMIVEEEEEFQVEKILGKRIVRGRGRGGPRKLQYLVKWEGYAEPDWQPAENLENTVALDDYLKNERGGNVTG
jgi:hypothetical protein